MNRVIVLILCLILPVSVIADIDVSDMTKTKNEDTDIVGKPDSECEQTKGEKGTLASLISTYTKVRNVVKITYDEIQYWKGIGATYKKLKKWFSNQVAYFKQVRNIGTEILSGKGDIFTKMEKAEQMFDIIDHVVLYEARKLDNIFCNLEYYHDKSALLPNTDKIVQGLGYIFDGSCSTDPKESTPQNLDTDEIDEYNKSKEMYETNKKRLKDLQVEKYPEFKIIQAGKTLSASGIAKSGLYFQWAVNSIDHYNEIDEKTKNLNNVNEINLYAAWLMIEQVNAHNKKIRHMSEELKLYSSLLAFDIWDASFKRSLEIANEENMEMMVLNLMSNNK